ncbi:hypothetical protein SISNIDRAFT_471643 [Sistotremastrum niveocremeum HHB9708]|uniref:Uncharacterized protein n=1 Tax=Sistotremastrum niveocremeum HHB9708 TaxID=1314777 RepID=A0A164MDT7_9AGAM|nr:hypothetical protein SISNIDRAFT_471643 [Sistotremastrum niveocremeum HHB9708]
MEFQIHWVYRISALQYILEAMTHIRNNHIYAERYTHTFTVTFVASIVPIEHGINIANTVHSQPDSPLQIACLVPNLSSHFKWIRDCQCAEMENIFRSLARNWYISRDVNIPTKESNKESGGEDSEDSVVASASVSMSTLDKDDESTEVPQQQEQTQRRRQSQSQAQGMAGC